MKFLKTYKLYEDNHKDYLQWKRKNITLRGISSENISEPNSNREGVLGDGLYTAPLSYKELAKKYGKVFFVLNAKPKHPKVFNGLNEWEIWFYNMLVFPFSKKKGKDYPDRRDFNENTSIRDEMLKLGFDGIEIKGREMVNFKPENVMFFRTERELENYFSTEREFGRL